MIEVQTCCTVVCDGCRAGMEWDYTPHFPSADEARDAAKSDEWWCVEGKDFCPDCAPSCTCGHSYSEHDPHDFSNNPCESCECEGFKLDHTA